MSWPPHLEDHVVLVPWQPLTEAELEAIRSHLAEHAPPHWQLTPCEGAWCVAQHVASGRRQHVIVFRRLDAIGAVEDVAPAPAPTPSGVGPELGAAIGRARDATGRRARR